MSEEMRAALVIAQAACCMARMAGMAAENQQRLHRGESIAYPESAFTELIDNEFSMLRWNDCIGYLQGR